MPNSLVKFAQRTNAGGGQKLWWHRSDIDGLPFRGANPPIMPEEEYENRAVRVADYRNAFFDVSKADENRKFLDVMECCANGWFFLHYIERFWNQTTKHYIEWVEYYMEDGTRTPYSTPGMMELANGQAHR